MDNKKTAELIAKRVKEAGGECYYVGGYVRDKLLGIENKDIDIEVHGISAEKLRGILKEFGAVLEMGESFGIFSLKNSNIDIALPRTEKPTGNGHRDFDICVNPFIGTYKAALRRDFTVNAIMENILDGEITDHFGGIDDLKKGVLRHVNDKTFAEDPLRVLRLAQFCARFSFEAHSSTKEICKAIDLSGLSKERIEAELKKALLKSQKPSVFFTVLFEINGLDYWFTEVKNLIGIKQNPLYHPEGDVFVHTMQVLDNAVNFLDKVNDKFAFMLSALVHDLGKAVATKEINGVIHAYGHENDGPALVQSFLEKITNEKSILSYCINMTQLHMKPNVLARERASVKSTNKLFDKSIAPYDLICLALSDDYKNHEENQDFLIERLKLYEKIMARPFVQGRDLIEQGISPDKSFSEALAYAHKLRLAGIEKADALKQTVAYCKKINKKNK